MLKSIFIFWSILSLGAPVHADESFVKALNNLARALQPTPTPQLTPKEMPRLIWVDVVNATVGPSKIGGAKWDGFGKVSPALSSKVANALLGANPYSAAIALLGEPVASVSEKPDPFGSVEVAIHGEYKKELQRCLFSPCDRFIRDTYTPTFSGVGYKNIPLDSGTRIRVTMWDKDLSENDPIGVAEINSKDLENALAAEKIYQVQVADQTQSQLLFIGIEVRLSEAAQ